MLDRLGYTIDKLIKEVNRGKINPNTCKILIEQINKYIKFIEQFASEVQFENTELNVKIRYLEQEIKRLKILNRTNRKISELHEQMLNTSLYGIG